MCPAVPIWVEGSRAARVAPDVGLNCVAVRWRRYRDVPDIDSDDVVATDCSAQGPRSVCMAQLTPAVAPLARPAAAVNNATAAAGGGGGASTPGTTAVDNSFDLNTGALEFKVPVNRTDASAAEWSPGEFDCLTFTLLLAG